MDIKLRQIVSKAAGTYFIVTDASQVTEIEAENKMRLLFINTEKGPVNSLFTFAKGDTVGFNSVFGNASRKKEKGGNFSHSTCLKSLSAGPIAVINLREFTSDDKSYVQGLNANRLTSGNGSVDYSTLFNTNAFWAPKKVNLESIASIEADLLQFANIGTNNPITIIGVKSTKVSSLTSEGEEKLSTTKLEILDYPLLLANPNLLVEDTFIDVYVFNNAFTTPNTNQYFGHLFNASGEIELSRIDELIAIKEAGFVKVFTGSIIPNLKSEDDVEISIDSVINQLYMQYGLMCNINEDKFELTDTDILDFYGTNIYSADDGTLVVLSGSGQTIYSHSGPLALTYSTVVYPPTVLSELTVIQTNIVDYTAYDTTLNTSNITFRGAFEQGLKIGDKLYGEDGPCIIESMEIISTEDSWYGTEEYTLVEYTYSGVLKDEKIKKINSFVEYGSVKPSTLNTYVLRSEQLTDGTATRQNTILNMMNNPGIVKGIKGVSGLRYVVDCFKSFVEPSYKSQFGSLMVSLDEGNRFLRAIINEPFIEDLQNSSNPLFKQTPSGVFDFSYVAIGGNKTYSTKLLTKFATGSDMCFFFGPEDIVKTVNKGIAGQVSNLFYGKRYAFDVVANESGYIDGITELGYAIDDDERVSCEKFRYNPIIDLDGALTIYGNNSGTAIKSAQQQIQNSELLAYIKESLYKQSKSEAFKPGNYDDYLRTETESKNFMEALALAGAIKPNPIVQCDANNNTTEISKQRIKLVHIEYTPTDSLEKVVFDLQIN